MYYLWNTYEEPSVNIFKPFLASFEENAPYLGLGCILIGVIYIGFSYIQNRNRKVQQANDIYESIIQKLKALKGTEREWFSEKLLKAELMENHAVNSKNFIWNWMANRSKRDKRVKVQPLSISGEQIQTWTYADF